MSSGVDTDTSEFCAPNKNADAYSSTRLSPENMKPTNPQATMASCMFTVNCTPTRSLSQPTSSFSTTLPTITAVSSDDPTKAEKPMDCA